MIAAIALDSVDGIDSVDAIDRGAEGDARSLFADAEPDPLARLIARLDRQIARRDDALDDPFVLSVSCRASVPLALCGTRTRPGCDGSHAGRCRAACEGRSREWRAELNAAESGPDGRGRYDLVYVLRWTSDWYRDRGRCAGDAPTCGRILGRLRSSIRF